MASLRSWYGLIKPGIVYGNAWHFLAGGLVAMTSLSQFSVLFWGLVGTSVIVAAACVANNIIDRKYDAIMHRTKKRAIASGEIKTLHAVMFSVLLLLVGSFVLYVSVPIIVLVLGVLGYVGYSFIYTYSKRVTPHSTLIGTFPGSIPIVAGYTVISGELNSTAWLLFLFIAAWQMTHFYAITIFRKDDYRAANLPVLSAVRPFRRVWIEMFAYWAVYIGSATVLTFWGDLNLLSGAILITLGLWWGWQVWLGRNIKKISAQQKWAKSVFVRSLLLSMLLTGVMALQFVIQLV